MKGHVSVEKDAEVATIKVSTNVANDVKVTLNSAIESIIAKEGVLSSESKIDKAETKYEIGKDNTVAIGDAVAMVDGTLYDTFDNAFDAARNGKELVLLKDVTLNKIYQVEKINLSGCNIAFEKKTYFSIKFASTFHVTGTGLIYEKDPYYSVIMVANEEMTSEKAVLTIDKNVTLQGWAGLFVDSYNANGHWKNQYNFEANIYGTLIGVKDTSGDTGPAVYVNGSNQYTGADGIKVNIYQTAKLHGSGNGVYAAGYAEWVVYEGALIEGDITGFEIRAGKLTMNGGKIIGKGTPTSSTPNGNGSTSTGVGLAVAQHTTKLPIEVTVNGGTITGYTAIDQKNPQNNDSEAVSKVKVTLKGGTFECYDKGMVVAYFENYEVVTEQGATIASAIFSSGYKLQKNDKGCYRFVPLSFESDNAQSSWADVK